MLLKLDSLECMFVADIFIYLNIVPKAVEFGRLTQHNGHNAVYAAWNIDAV